MIPLLLTLVALQVPLDEGTLVIREDTSEIAREGFRLTAAGTGAGVMRWTLAHPGGGAGVAPRPPGALHPEPPGGGAGSDRGARPRFEPHEPRVQRRGPAR